MSEREKTTFKTHGIPFTTWYYPGHTTPEEVAKKHTDEMDTWLVPLVDAARAIHEAYPDMEVHTYGPTFNYLGRNLSIRHPWIQQVASQQNNWRSHRPDYTIFILEDRSKKKTEIYKGDYNTELILHKVEKWRRDVVKRDNAAKKAKLRKFQKRMEEAEPFDLLIASIKEFYSDDYNIEIRSNSVYLTYAMRGSTVDVMPCEALRITVNGWAPGQRGKLHVAFRYNFHGRVGRQWVEWKKSYEVIPEDPSWDAQKFIEEIDGFISEINDFRKRANSNGWKK
jgi:hypothetical protein